MLLNLQTGEYCLRMQECCFRMREYCFTLQLYEMVLQKNKVTPLGNIDVSTLFYCLHYIILWRGN